MGIDSLPPLNLIKVSVDIKEPSLLLSSNWLIIGVLVGLSVLGLIVLWFMKRKNLRIYDFECELSSTPKAKFKVQRNTENLFIANRILIELTTRKAALPFDEENDVISEVYDSWYKLFGIIRDEIKTLPGHYLVGHDPTTALIGLSQKILNDALRPHLTLYQARFRRWFEQEEQEEKNSDLSPQEIQRKYPDYDKLVKSLKEVNVCLISFAGQLESLIKGR